ncbi:hypothetical protein [Vibrio gallaecicus]|uniref:hypothetical protein n=1 Tax=Vibrio gallaecicus TaxID=552386 RepID=UPI0025B540A2|nr:hypothetical protein [Vibrio gallaecicus]MDN3617724.1 hypothetical protein [Vibrio gallaecicus]
MKTLQTPLIYGLSEIRETALANECLNIIIGRKIGLCARIIGMTFSISYNNVNFF